MDIFKFNTHPATPTLLTGGEVINYLTSKMWVERYRDAGEFKLVGGVESGLREKLPLGCLISHTDSDDVMMVENHEITEERGSEPQITITGRSFEAFLENRIVGANREVPDNTGGPVYILPAAESWLQATTLITDHIIYPFPAYAGDEIPYVTVGSSVDETAVTTEKDIALQPLYDALLQLLAIDNLGIKTIRPGVWSPLGVLNEDIYLLVHKGTDRITQVSFSYDAGEIESADYLWSIKNYKNDAFVSGKWLSNRESLGAVVGYDLRQMWVDASDIDGRLDAMPTLPEETTMLAYMSERAKLALAAQQELALTRVELAQDSLSAKYRQDYNVGDLVTVHGDYNASAIMRVSEYVEIEDETGRRGYPTLTKEF